jgi:hypothetical protein
MDEEFVEVHPCSMKKQIIRGIQIFLMVAIIFDSIQNPAKSNVFDRAIRKIDWEKFRSM